MITQQATATQATYQPQRMPPIQPTPYTLGFNAGREGVEYANPYWGKLPQWLAYDTGHRDGRKATDALAAVRGGG